MIERLVSILVGGVVTLLLLLLFHNGRIINDEYTGYLVAVVVGAVLNLFWPFIWSRFSSNRARSGREEAIQLEVQRQVNAQRPTEE